MNIKTPKLGMSGRFRLVVSKDPDGEEVVDEIEFDNLITDVGLNRIGTVVSNGNTTLQIFQNLCGRFVLGSGNSTPSFTDTALESPTVFAASDVVESSSTSSYALGYSQFVVSHQFGQGVAAGNHSEIGIQHTSMSGPLWSRALILDGEGNPTTITVTESDFLTCYYSLRIMIPQEDVVYQIPVDYGDDGVVPTTVTIRPLSTNSASPTDGWGLNTFTTSRNANNFQFYSGGLAAPTATAPLGSGAGGFVQTTASAVPYVTDSHEKHVFRNLGLNEINSTNLRTAKVVWLMGSWQAEFDPPLQKNNTQTMRVQFGYSWGRA